AGPHCPTSLARLALYFVNVNPGGPRRPACFRFPASHLGKPPPRDGSAGPDRRGTCGLGTSATGPSGKMFVGDQPGLHVRGPFLADPVEAVGGDLREAPSRLQAARILADLYDVPALRPSDLARIVL